MRARVAAESASIPAERVSMLANDCEFERTRARVSGSSGIPPINVRVSADRFSSSPDELSMLAEMARVAADRPRLVRSGPGTEEDDGGSAGVLLRTADLPFDSGRGAHIRGRRGVVRACSPLYLYTV